MSAKEDVFLGGGSAEPGVPVRFILAASTLGVSLRFVGMDPSASTEGPGSGLDMDPTASAEGSGVVLE